MSAPDPASTADGDVEVLKAPGLAALLRRHPQFKRHAAFGSIAIGAVLFVAASMTTPLAGAQTSHGDPPARTTPVRSHFDLGAFLPLVDTTATPAGTQAPAAKPVHVKKKAPASKAVITGLAANGIPNVALNAYRVAAARMDHADPGCGLDWSLLAGIGREESDHGQFAGATLNADGTSTPRIIGIPLNGKGTEVVRDTDHGRLDGDTVYDRAVGPMQFIPSTWAIYGVDANGDGKADPFNINDAALTAARYLCAAGGNLRTHAGQVAAVLSYNHSDQYLAQVLALADAYHRGISISGIPVGNVTGTVTPAKSKNVPAANPAPPTAVGHTTAKKHTAKPKAAAKSTPAAGTRSSAPAGGAGAPTGSTPSQPSPGTGSSSTPSTGSSSTPPAGTPSSGPSSDPSATPTQKCVLWDVLNPGRCAIYG